MNSKSLTTVCVLLATIKIGVLSQDVIMSWHINSTRGSETLKFTQEAFQEFSVCMCTPGTKSCTLFSNQTTGIMSYVNTVPFHPDDDMSQTYHQTYLCERVIGTVFNVVRCTRLDLSLCSDATSCWSYDILFNNEPCELAPVKITWTSSQQFQMSFDNTSLTISSCNLTCPSAPASQSTTPMLSQSSEDTTKFSTSTKTATNQTVGAQDDDNNTGTIIGVVVAMVICAALVAVGLVFWWRRNKARKADISEGHQSPSSEMVNSDYINPDNGHSGSHENDTSYVNVPARQTRHNSMNPSYYNLTDGEAEMNKISTLETTNGMVSTAERRKDHGSVTGSEESVDGYEEPVTSSTDQHQSQPYYNTL